MSDYAIVTVEQRYTAVVKSTVAMADMPQAERAARAKIAEALAQLNVGPEGDSFTLCRMPRDGKMHYEPGVIVARACEPTGDVVPSELPAGRAVRHVLVGPFDRLPQAWPAIFSWCSTKALKLEGTFWQVYGPTAADPQKQVTTLFALLA
jgi:effector-binding domain-containing protein